MTAGLDVLTDLEDRDIVWLLDNGEERQVIANTALYREGEPSSEIIIVLEGLLGVFVSSVPNQQVGALGPGEILGDISFLTNSEATATVQAVENSLLLCIPSSTLRDALASDSAFASRVYRALAVANTKRLRAREQFYARQIGVETESDRQDSETWTQLQPKIEGFKALLQEADKAAIANSGEVPEDLSVKVCAAFPQFSHDLQNAIGDECGLHESAREAIGARVQREALPYLLLTETAERLYSKPRGYAGDFKSIDQIYDNVARGSSRLGTLLDRAFLDQVAARAVRNRRGLLTKRIDAHLAASPDRPVRITVMACGPAREVFDAFEKLEDKSRLEVTLIDIDQQALEQVRGDIERLGLSEQVHAMHGNLVYLAMGRQKIEIPPQDLMYSIGLIDYFNDKLVRKLASWAHSCLRDGGELILGNFHPNNPDKALMDYVFEWRLIHRTEDEMHALFESSAFGRRCTSIEFEDAGINLFAACSK